MIKLSGKTIIYILQSLVTWMVLVLVLFAAGLAEKFHASWDWTENQSNSLSPRSAQTLQNMPGSISIIAAYSQRAEGVKPELEKIFNLYLKVKPDLQIEYLNSTLEPQRAQDLDIRQDVEIILSYRDRSRTITDINENEISNALLRLSQDQEVRVLWLEKNLQSSQLSSNEPNGISAWAQSLQVEGVDTESINLILTPDLEERSADLLIVSAPQSPLLEKEIELIDRYILSGGNALILLDPNQDNGLATLLGNYGVVVKPGAVIDTLGERFFGSPLFVTVSSFPEHKVLERLESFLAFPLAGSVDYLSLSDSDGWARKFLLRSGKHTWLETNQTIELNPEQGESLGEIPIALVMTRPLDALAQTQAFKGGTSLSEPSQGGETAATAEIEKAGHDGHGHGENEHDEQRLIIVADTDFLLNQHIGRGANLVFANDMVNWLSGNEDVLEITREKPGDRNLGVKREDLGFLFGFWGVFVPAIFLFIGIFVAVRRRRLR